MRAHSLASVVFLSLLTLGCATSDDRAAVGRAVVNTGLVAASMAGYGSLPPENCELHTSEYERGVCIKRKSEMAAARGQTNQPMPKPNFEMEDSSDSSVVKFGVTR